MKFFVFISALMAKLIALVITGYVITVLWGWFVVPMFSLPALTMPYAIGLLILFELFKNGSDSRGFRVNAEQPKEALKALGTAVWEIALSGAIALLIGWIITLFII